MENNDTDIPVTSVDSSDPEQVGQKAQSTSVSDKPPDASNHEDPGATKHNSTQSKDSAETQPEGRDSTSAETKPPVSSSTSASQNYVPPVKRFSAVNINKKFLQKNQPSAASSGSSLASSANKQPGAIARPAPQTAHSHSRLVTAKLTATPLSSSPGPGWSRPNSVTPPAPSPANSSGAGKGSTATIAPAGGHGPPQIAPGGKIIQPQVLKPKTDGPGKSVWKNVQPGAVSAALQAQKEFPTAAEAAQSRLAKISESKTQAGLVEAQKQALSETADAFRGVHLDPNAHHWDEMEEEGSDDFLGDVIEFGDGRQYTIHASEGGTTDSKVPGDGSASEAPVTKEERFADDFDRSWPKSRQESGKDDSAHRTISEISSNLSGHSPASVRDSNQSRLLFNERSNRMEPISESKPAPRPRGQSGGVQIHRESAEVPGRFHGNRVERDTPPHVSFRRPHEPAWGASHGFDQHALDLRELKSESISYFQSGNHDRKGRPDWSSDRSHGGLSSNGQSFGSREPSTSRSVVNGAPSIADSDNSSRYTPSVRDQHRADSSAAPSTEIERQLPPHLSQPRTDGPPGQTPTEADGHWNVPRAPRSVVSEAASLDQSQSESSRPAQTQPGAGIPKATTSIPPDEVEALRKAYLHERAERAKLRRQKEEEEWLKAQERARQKADELEAKIVAAKAAEEAKRALQQTVASNASAVQDSSGTRDKKPTEAEVLRVIEGAISSAVPSETSPNGKTREFTGNETDSRKLAFAKVVPDVDSNRPAHDTKEPNLPPRTAVATKADQVDSWRPQHKPPMLPVENSKNDISQRAVTSVLPAVHAFDIEADESTEVIDFSDMGRLAEDRKPQQHRASETDATSMQRVRPVASDFFKKSTTQQSEEESWRKGHATSHRPVGADESSQYKATSGNNSIRVTPVTTEDGGGQRANVQNHSKPHFPQATNGFIPPSASNQDVHTSSPNASKFLRSPNVSYREAPLSALDDTMSRIKGALDIMHSTDHGSRETRDSGSGNTSMVRLPASSASPSTPTKWLPPALRPPSMASNSKRTDTFEPTHSEPPRSPAPPDKKFAVRLPGISRKVEPLTKRQINYQKYFGPVRWEILSFDPPVEGMTKKSLSVNDVLFRKPVGPYKLRKYQVSLPKSKVPLRRTSSQGIASDNAPSTSVSRDVADGSFGVARTDQNSWRSVSTSARTEGKDVQDEPVPLVLDVTSRSPPPDLVAKSGQVPTVSRVASKPKSHRSLDVTDVAFYRDVRKSTAGNANMPIVSFTVGSELEGQSNTSTSHQTPTVSTDSPKTVPSTISQQSAPERSSPERSSADTLVTPSLPASNAELSSLPRALAKSAQQETSIDKTFESDPFLQQPSVTPPPQNTPSSWSKSPARVPDPELLKAVWSQPSNNTSVPAVNSLKNIADDLTSVPFTLQEVKSEGGTPPPATSGHVVPTRMSASEVTRAFQTVPSGPSTGVASSALRGGQVSSNVGSPIGSQRALKPPSIGLPPPPIMNPGAPRPPYMGYPTHMNNHTPSPPTLVYSHVMPNGLPGSPAGTPYSQPMWVPIVQQGPQMLRAQSSSPYSPSAMPYTMPAAQNGMFSPPSNVQSLQGSPAAYPSGPPPSQIMVSPVMAHASAAPSNAMYPASPMIMHMPPPGAAGPRPYLPSGPVGMGRGSMPVQNSMDLRSHPVAGPPTAPVSRFPSHNQGYTPVPPQSFVHPW